MTLTADQTYSQVRWEQEGINRGIKRYREAALVADPTTLPPGQAMLRAVVPPLVEAIRAVQAEAKTGGAGEGPAPPWLWMIQLLPPDKLALLTASQLLRMTEGTGGQALITACALGRTCRLQVEMDRWVRQMTDARKDRKVADPDAPPAWDALASFRTRYPNADTRTWRNWRKRIEGLETETWTQGQEAHLGGHLIYLATASCPEWFTMETERIGAKTKLMVRLSEKAQETMKDLSARAELASPTRLPMIVPPLAWRYEDQGVAA